MPVPAVVAHGLSSCGELAQLPLAYGLQHWAGGLQPLTTRHSWHLLFLMTTSVRSKDLIVAYTSPSSSFKIGGVEKKVFLVEISFELTD